MAGKLSGTIAIGRAINAPLTGSATLDAATMVKFLQAANLAGSGAFTAPSMARYDRAALLSGIGTYAPTTSQIYPLAAALNSNGTLTAPSNARYAQAAALLSTGQLQASVLGFVPFNEENINRTNQPVPTGCVGVWVTLNGAGGSGGTGCSSSTPAINKCAGSGGGGAAAVLRTFVPVAQLGSTFSVTRPLGATAASSSSNPGIAGNDGGDAVFTSGSVVLTAGGGKAGAGGVQGQLQSAGGAGGVASYSGPVGPLSVNGTAGGDGHNGGGDDAIDGVGGGAGGGGGGGCNATGAQLKGGAGGTANGTPGVAGAAGGTAGGDGQDMGPGVPGSGGGGGGGKVVTTPGGDGGAGGNYGGGGGGSGSSGTASKLTNSGPGGDGYTLLEFTNVVPVVSPISVIGTPTATSSGSFALPTHAIGDLILVAVGGPAGTTPSKPTATGTVPAWNTIDAAPSGQGLIVCYFVATANNHTSGAWSSGICGAAAVLRGQNASPIGAHALGAAAVVIGSSTAPAVTLTRPDGSSFIWHVHYHVGATSWPAAPAGYTRMASNNAGSSTSPAMCQNRKNDTTSDGAVTQADGGSSSQNYRCATVEILAP